MKRWLSGLMAALALFSLAGCGGIPDQIPDDPRDQTITLPVEEPETAAGLENTPGEEASGEDDPLPPDDPDTGAADLDAAADLESPPGNAPEDNRASEEDPLPENGSYTTKEDVALYIHTYGRLPDNFITKKEAQNLGWPGGNLEPYAPGMCIGGSRFGNYEGLLPEAEGRTYTECDIDTLGAKSRGAKRIVFSNDGLVYYTEDHYESFELLYGDEDNG